MDQHPSVVCSVVIQSHFYTEGTPVDAAQRLLLESLARAARFCCTSLLELLVPDKDVGKSLQRF